MGLTNFPGGVSSFGLPVLPGLLPVGGKVFFVSSVIGSDGYEGSFERPYATIDYAIGFCLDSKGDVIIALPGHAESISGAAAIACDVIGITILGLGSANLRPTITLHSTATTIAISAANVTLRNLIVKTDVDAVVKVFNITGAGCTLDAVDFAETASCAALQLVLTTAAADDLTIMNCVWIQTQTAATALQQWIVLVGADRAKIINNFASLKGYATSNPANGVVVGATTASNDVLLQGNTFVIVNSTGNIPISMLANSTGFARQNYVASSKTAVAGSIALANLYASENYASNTVNVQGFLDPVVDT